MTVLATVFASAPTSEVLIPTLEILVPGHEPIRICCGFEDQWLTLETSDVALFEAGSLSVSLPGKNNTGNQTLTFGVANVNGTVQRYVDAALAADVPVQLIFRMYLASDRSAPAEPPRRMTLRGGVLEGGDAQFEAGYYDLLNTAWPRDRYTEESAPGLKYL